MARTITDGSVADRLLTNHKSVAPGRRQRSLM